MNILFHIGGPDFHPVAAQAHSIAEWVGGDFDCQFYEGAEAFDHLADCDLLVLMGLFWSGNPPYVPPSDAQKAAFEEYVAAGKPLLLHHGGVASYDDWPRFGELCGFWWEWGHTNHGPIDYYEVKTLATGHQLLEGVSDFRVFDEAYYDLRQTPAFEAQAHLETTLDNGRVVPLLLSGQGGRTDDGGRTDGAGRVVYIVLGHDERAFEAPALRQIWLNAIHFLLPKP